MNTIIQGRKKQYLLIDNAFAVLPCSNFAALKTRRVVRVNNANDLLLVIPPLSAPKFSSRTTKREGISWSTIDFIQNASYTAEIAPYDDSKDRYSQTKDTYGRDKRQIDSIQTLSTFPIEIIAFKVTTIKFFFNV